MKPATVPQSGQVIETTTRQRVVPDSSLPIDSKTPSLWEYLADVEKKREWDKHTIYLHRMEPGNPDGSGMIVWKGAQYLTLPDGTQVPLWDREEVEFALLKHYGGKRFRLMVKRGAQLVTRGEIFIDAAPRMIVPPANSPNPNGSSSAASVGGESATAAVAGRAFDALTLQERQSAEIGFTAMRTGMDAMTRAVELQQRAASAPQQTPPSEIDSMFKMLMLKMMEMMFARFAAPADANVGNVTEKILTVAVDRMLNPPPASAAVSPMAEVVRQAPQIISGLAETIREQRQLIEAQARFAPGRPLGPGAPLGPSVPNPQVIPPVVQQQAPAPGQPHTGAPTMEFVETKIMEIFKQPISAQQAADEAMAFLDTLDPNAIAQLAALGEEGMLRLFASRPILAHATANPTRLTEFIRAFLKMHAEDQAAESAQPAAKPPLPN